MATKKTVVQADDTSSRKTIFKTEAGAPNYPAIILAEIIGTFVLTIVAVAAMQQLAPLYVGLTVAALVLAVGAISGAHLNPAVTFGLWSARRLKTSFVPVYWLSQFVGAILAILVTGAFAGSKYALDLSSFGKFDWGVTGVEIVGTAVFLFGILAITSHATLSAASKAFGVGLSLTVALVLATSLFTSLKNGADTSTANVNDINTIPRSYITDGATLNPAVALAVTEKTVTDFGGTTSDGAAPARPTRLGAEVIVGTLVGAALGANLYVLLAYAGRTRKVAA